MKKGKIFKVCKFTILGLMLFFSLLPIQSQAQTAANQDYTVLAPLPNTADCSTDDTGKQICKTNFSKYLPSMFNLIIGVAAGLAFIMITIGGITYATSDALQGKSDGRRYVTNAIYGLILVIGAYTILWTINPQILDFSLVVTPPTITPSTSTVVTATTCRNCTTNGILNGYTLTTAEIAENAAIVKDLQQDPAYKVYVNNNGVPCSNGETKGCTNVVLLPPGTIDSVKTLKKSLCPTCVVVISGGTEGGHAEHGPGKPVIDLQPTQSLNDFLAKKANPPVSTPRSGTTVVVGNGTYKYEETGDNGRASAPHWHVVYK